MRLSVYVETMVVSYLAGRTSRQVRVAARQRITSEWWRTARDRFDLRVSWNMKHVVNGVVIRRIREINESRRMKTPVICAPEELMEAP